MGVASAEDLQAERSAEPGLTIGASDIAKKPNYDFERRERERNKAAESAKKAQAKADKRAAESNAPDVDQGDGS